MGYLGSRRALLAGGAGLPTLDLHLTPATFSAAMAKRDGPGPFAAAPIIQGSLTDDTVQPDVLSFDRGTQVSGHWYDDFDPYQGTVSFFMTPEWDGDDGLNHHILDCGDSSGDFLLYKNSDDNLYLYIGGQYMTLDVSGMDTAGTTYHVAIRWDQQNTLDGTNYACITIDDSHTFGITTQPTAEAPASTLYVGSSGTQYPANAIIEGLTIYRRPLYDGTYGVDVGNGDELAQIYNAGSGQDPTLVTGAWDVVFCMPTDASVGELSTGTGEAWTMPHRTGNILTDAFCQTTYGSSGWSTKGTPSDGPKDIATASEQLFGVGGYEFTVDADAEGIEQSLTGLDAGESYVIRVIAHEDDSNDIRVRVYDDTNTADLVTFTFGSGSSKDAPGVALFTFELPTNARNGVASDCTAITVSVEGTNAGQTVYVQQVELYENLIDNPSLETGAGDPWIPSGWANSDLDSGDSEAEATTVHSGSGSMELNTGASAEYFFPNEISKTAGVFYASGFWHYGDGSAGVEWRATSSNFYRQDGTSTTVNSPHAASWSHVPVVFAQYTTLTSRRPAFRVDTGATGDRFLDDVYYFPLTAVSLTATPQSEANSTESGAISVTGRDTLTMPWARLTATEGRIRFKWTPRHDAAELGSFSETGTALILRAARDADNFLRVTSAANSIQLNIETSGNASATTWDCTGEIVAGTTYDIEVRYDSSKCELLVDGVVKTTAPPAAGINWASLPTSIYFGSRNHGDRQGDAYFAPP